MTRKENDALFEQYQNQDLSIRDKIFVGNMKLADALAKKYTIRGVREYDDLCQIAYISLLKSIDKFNPSLGFAFSTFATRCIDNDILRYIQRSEHSRWKIRVVSMYAVVGADEDSLETLLDHMASNDNTELFVEDRMLCEDINKWVLSTKSERIIYVYNHTFGMNGHGFMTPNQMRLALGISQSAVSRIQKVLIDDLKLYFGGVKNYGKSIRRTRADV